MARSTTSKLRYAFQVVLEGNKPSYRKRTSEVDDITFARLRVGGTNSSTDSPALAFSVRRGNSPQSLYLFNLSYSLKHTTGKSSSNEQLRALFMTGLSWEKQGMGSHFVLVGQKQSQPNFALQEKLHIHGPSGLTKFMNAVYSFVFSPKKLERFRAHTAYCEDEEALYVDENIVVKKVFSNPEKEGCNPGIKPSVSYICQMTGAFQFVVNSEKLKTEHGMVDWEDWNGSKRRLFRKLMVSLSRGKSGTHPITGEAIDPSEFTSRRKPPTFLVLDLPSQQHFDIIEKSDALAKHFENTLAETPILIVHITPSMVFSSQPYQNWMKKFGTRCDHLLMSDADKDYYLHSVMEHQYTMNRVCNELFPPVNESLILEKEDEEAEAGTVVQARSGLQYHFSKENSYWSYAESSELLDDDLSEAKEKLSAASQVINGLGDTMKLTPPCDDAYYPRLVVLGCGASAPQKYRAQPGFLFLVDDKSSILMDAGGTTLQRIYQQFGNDAEKILLSIKAVFLSHVHLDHHSGFITVLKGVARVRQLHKKSFEDNVKIYCIMPLNMVMFYDSYCKKYLPQIHDMVVFVPVEKARHGHTKELDTVSAMRAILGMKVLSPVPVTHGVITYGLSLTTRCGKKVVYSSDTLPMNDRLIYEGEGADLLIHDCLYVDEDWEMDAQIRRHSYLKGTLATASAMQAKFTLLTHFAPFLPVVPVANLPKEYASKVACAYDFLNVSLADLHQLPKLESRLLAVHKDSIERYNLSLNDRKCRHTYRTETVKRLVHII